MSKFCYFIVLILCASVVCASPIGYKFVGISGTVHYSNLSFVPFVNDSVVVRNLENYTINVTVTNNSVENRYVSKVSASQFYRPKQYYEDTSFRVVKEDSKRTVNYAFRANPLSSEPYKTYSGFESAYYVGSSKQLLNDVHNIYSPYRSKYGGVLASSAQNDALYSQKLSNARQSYAYSGMITGTYDYGYKGTEQRTGRIVVRLKNAKHE